MFAGAIPLIAKIAMPLIGNVVQSIFQSKEPQATEQAPPETIGQQLASHFDVKNMSLNELESLANHLYDSGTINREQYSTMLGIRDKIAADLGSDVNKSHNILFLSSKMSQDLKPFPGQQSMELLDNALNIFKGLDALRGAKASAVV